MQTVAFNPSHTRDESTSMENETVVHSPTSNQQPLNLSWKRKVQQMIVVADDSGIRSFNAQQLHTDHCDAIVSTGSSGIGAR
jgi:hypothetical protein